MLITAPGGDAGAAGDMAKAAAAKAEVLRYSPGFTIALAKQQHAMPNA